jgi:hypothetical protein
MRQRTLLSAALLVVAACSDQPTGLEPTPAPHPSFDRNEVEQVAPTGTGATTITLVERNISGNGAAVCSSGEVGRGPTGWKVDGASGTTRDGLKFTVTDGKYLAFSRVSGDNVVTAVVVKGGEFTYVYDYGAGATSGAGLRAPLNGGGNVPTISHYTFATSPARVDHEGADERQDGRRQHDAGRPSRSERRRPGHHPHVGEDAE